MCLSEYLKKNGVSDKIENLEQETKNLFPRLKNALVIFDDANDFEIQQWIEKLPDGFCRYLVTTYHSSGIFAQKTKIQVEKLDKTEGCSLFLQLLPENRRIQSEESVERLVEFCDGLPLAIQQAAAYISRTGIPLEKFLHNLQTEQITGKDLDWDIDGIPYTGKAHPGVYYTFKQSYDWIIQSGIKNSYYKICGKILQYLAFLDPMCISEEFLRSLDPDFDDEAVYNASLSAAIKFGLLEREDRLKMRGVVQQVIRQLMTEEQQKLRLSAIVKQLGIQSSGIIAAQRNFDRMQPVFLHLSYMQPLKGYKFIFHDAAIAELYCFMAEFLFEIGDYEGCEARYKIAEEIGTELTRLKAWTGLAMMYENQDDYENAQDCIQKTEKKKDLLTRLMGEAPKDYMNYLEVKGYLCIRNDQPQEAEDFFYRIIDYSMHASMEETQKNYKEMLAYNGMGMVKNQMRQYAAAETYFRKALEIGEKACNRYGMIMVTGNYGQLLAKTGRFEEAEQYLKEEEKLFENWTMEWKDGFAKSSHRQLWQYFFADRPVMAYINYAKNQYSLGNLYIRRNKEGDVDLVYQYLMHGEELLRRVHAETHMLMLNIEVSICGVLLVKGFYEEVIEKGISILERENEFRDNDDVRNSKTLLCEYLSKAYYAGSRYQEQLLILKKARKFVNTYDCVRKEQKEELRKEIKKARICRMLQMLHIF